MIGFSQECYGQILQRLHARNYKCLAFGDIKVNDVGANNILLRHDVDTNMDFALQLAELEAEYGCFSTYFVMLRSPMYNLFSRYNTKILWEIQKLGHHVGLHFDAAFTDETDMPLEEHLGQEIQILGELAQCDITSFSLHQPSAKVLSETILYKNVINTYDQNYLKEFEYISDSNRDWRGKDLFALIDQGRNLQLLTHPMWWVAGKESTEMCWNEAIKTNFANEQKQILQTERAYGPARYIEVHLAKGEA